ncbi:hypothetical protein ACKWTF_006503 [Chironomus riparius]
MNFFILIIVVFNIDLSHQLTLQCDFKVETTYLGTKYGCLVKGLTTTLKDRKIIKIVGNHQIGKSNDDVKLLFMKFQNVPYLPQNVAEFFPNLETFYVMKSNVQHLITGDLVGLDDLIHFDVSHNPIESIKSNFFENKTKLTKISFHDCHLKKIEKGAFDGQSSIQLLELNYNDCVSGKYPSTQSYYYRTTPLREFLVDVYDKCTGAGRVLKEDELIKECIEEEVHSELEHYGLVFKFGIVIICFLVITTIFLAYITYNFYKKSFKSDWNEVNFTVVSANLNGNGY